MKLNILSILTAALLGAAGSTGAAPITYNVNLTGGGQTVSGSITTDGVLGDINGHILSWEFVLTGLVSFTMSSATGSISEAGTVLSASSTELLLLDPSPTSGDNQQLFFLQAASGFCGPFLNFSRIGGNPGTAGAQFASDACTSGINGVFFQSATGRVVATAAQVSVVSEPSSLALAALALGGMVATRRRKR